MQVPNASIHVFISYASQDATVAAALVEALERHGVGCWIAPRDVKAGALYADAIVRAISGAKACVLVLSESAISSSHVSREIERASSKKRPIIALRIDAAPLTPALEYFLSESQWIEAQTGSMEAAYAKLIDDIRDPTRTAPPATPAVSLEASAATARAAHWALKRNGRRQTTRASKDGRKNPLVRFTLVAARFHTLMNFGGFMSKFVTLPRRAALVVALTALSFAVLPAHAKDKRASKPTTVPVAGLKAPVRIVIDRWGVPHLFAANEEDLFLAQGFNAARDRLFHIDLWRRRGLGELAEVFGPSYIEQDRATRLFLYRGDMDREWRTYTSRGTKAAERIAQSFVEGVNAYIDYVAAHPERLPWEFKALHYAPAKWRADEVVRLRSHGLTRNRT